MEKISTNAIKFMREEENRGRMIERMVIVSGDVQSVGYRDRVRTIGNKVKVVGMVKNLPDGNVEVICQGERDVLDSFMAAIYLHEEFIAVKDIEIVKEGNISEKSYDYFTIAYGELAEEFGERMSEGIKYIRDNRVGINELGMKMDSGFNELGMKMDSGFNELGKKIDTLTEHTDSNFAKLDVKYHRISEKTDDMDSKLGELTSEIKCISKNIELLVQAYFTDDFFLGKSYQPTGGK